LVSGTAFLPQGATVELVVVGTAADGPAEAARFRVFVHDPADRDRDRLAELSPVVASAVDEATAERLKLQKGETAYSLKVDLPRDTGLSPWVRKDLTVEGCNAAPGAPLTVARRQEVIQSRPLPTLALALLFTVGFHLSAALTVYQARKQAIRLTDRTDVTDSKRVLTLQPWTYWRCLDPVVMTSDEFDRGSLANLQILFFVTLVGFGMIDLALRTGVLSSLSPSIIYLLGIPAVGSLGTVVANVTRDRLSAENWAWLVNRGVLPANDPGRGGQQGDGPQWTDLFMTNTVLDMPKLQALAFSLIVGLAMVANGFTHFADFNVPDSLLQILGLSQLVFVGGRFTQPASMTETDKVLTELRRRAEDLIRAAASGVDVDPQGKPQPPAPISELATPRTPITTFALAIQPDGAPNAAQRYAEIEENAVVLLEALTHRQINASALQDPLSWSKSRGARTA
jgi:hypothetical protein